MTADKDRYRALTAITSRSAGRGPGSSGPAHVCPVGGCREPVRAGRLMCRPHWYQVPKVLRDAVWFTWRSGAGAGSLAHAAAILAAINAVNTRQEAGL